jgi:hypothetical protein
MMEGFVLIIFGWRVVLFTIGKGLFHCPSCGGDREYRRRQGRRFFTLFFIPVIPLTKAGPEFVECDTCHGRYALSVLSLPTAADLAAVPARLLRTAISQVLRSGDVTHTGARERTVALVRAAGDGSYDESVLDADLVRPFDEVRQEISRSSAQLAPEARERFLQQAAEIALIDGPLTFSERETLAAVGADLTLTRVQINAVIEIAERAAAS